MTDRDALERSVLLDPDEDVPRLEYADWLEENPGEGWECSGCKGKGSRFAHAAGSHGTTVKCWDCRGIGQIDAGHRERAELIRAGVELARFWPERKEIGKTEPSVPWVEMRSHGPGFWTFEAFSDYAVKVGDRVDVFGRGPKRDKAKVYHGLVVRRVEDRGSDGVHFAVARDDASIPWGGMGLAVRSRELVARGVGFGWWDVTGLIGPTLDGRGELAWYSTQSPGPPVDGVVSGAVRRGFIERITLPIAAYTPELAAAVFARHPVRDVVLSDAVIHLGIDPFLGGSGCFWRVNTLPMFLWKLVSTGSPRSRIADVYPTRDAAVEALSRAAVAWGRDRAGLTAATV